MHRAKCYFDQKMYEESILDLQTALQHSPNDSMLLYLLGLSFYADQNFKQCLKTFKQALMNVDDMDISVDYTPDIYYHIGLAYCMVEKFEKSIYPYTKVSIFSLLILYSVLISYLQKSSISMRGQKPSK